MRTNRVSNDGARVLILKFQPPGVQEQQRGQVDRRSQIFITININY
jgi:hypothetical protein